MAFFYTVMLFLVWGIVYLGTRKGSGTSSCRSGNSRNTPYEKKNTTPDGSYTLDGVRYNSQGIPHKRLLNKHGALGEDGFDCFGYDYWGYDYFGFDKDGYNRSGYDSEGFDRNGYNYKGFDRYGYDRNGYDKDGHDREGFDLNGVDHDGYDREGYNSKGYNRMGMRRTYTYS